MPIQYSRELQSSFYIIVRVVTTHGPTILDNRVNFFEPFGIVQ
jgi:hypothetical protein